MGQTLNTSSVTRVKLAAHIGLGLALPSALLILAVLGNASFDAYAASPPAPGLVISRSGDHVNVSLDSQAGSDVSIRRSDDVMVIKVPDSFDSKLVIDARLKKDNVVQETEISGGKIITINSQQIYLMTQENLKALEPTDAGSKPSIPVTSGQSAKPMGTSAAKPVNHGSRTAQPEPIKPETMSANMHAAVDTDHAGSAIESSMKPVGLVEKTKLMHSVNATSTVSSLKPLEKAALSSIPSIVPRGETSATKQAKKSSVSNQTKAADAATSDESVSKDIANEDADAPQTPSSDTQTGTDPEAQPLDLSGRQQASATRVASHALFRIVLSLLAVLGLLLGFVRVLLPKLMTRYPEFFERLRQRQTQPGQQHLENTKRAARMNRGLLFENPIDKPVKLQPKSPKPKLQLEAQPPQVAQTPEPINNAEVSPQPVETSSTALLRHVQDHQMTLLGSTPLGDGKEIHLVEVQGKQLVIATTPSTISFLTDLTDSLDEQDEETNQDQPPSVSSDSNPQPNVIAYLSDESPVISQQAEPAQLSKPYASAPSQVNQPTVAPPASVSSVQAQTQAKRRPNEAIYQKYLQPQPPYVDAEEVIVLADYDDVYGF
jgi:flagellar biogenesis protein FliO